jgi:hypothetical protein
MVTGYRAIIRNVRAADAHCQSGAVRFLRSDMRTTTRRTTAMTDTPKDAERDTRNRGLQEEEKRLHDSDARPPHSDMETDATQPERPTTPPENAEEDIAHLENPPQAEGPRERSNDAV